MSALMNTIDLIPMSDEEREAIIGPVQQSMRAVDRNRGGNGNDDDDDGDDDDLDTAPIDDGSDIDLPADDIDASPLDGVSMDGIAISPASSSVEPAGAEADTPAPRA